MITCYGQLTLLIITTKVYVNKLRIRQYMNFVQKPYQSEIRKELMIFLEYIVRR